MIRIDRLQRILGQVKLIVIVGVVVALSAGAVCAEDPNTAELTEQWHQFRGPLANGVAPKANPPIEWGPDSNIRWKTEIPGEGSSTPIVWENKVFLLTAIQTDRIDESLPAPEDQPERPFNIKFPNAYFQFDVICLDRTSGDIVWQKTAVESVPVEGVHPDNDFASSSPTTDGERLYVPFGSQGFYCYDLDGNLLWERDLGTVATRLSFGEGASLTVHGDSLIVVRDQEEQSKIYVLNAATGDIRWEEEREEPTCWATPLVVEHAGRTQVITNGSEKVRSYDLESGELIWECGGQVANVTPSPVLVDDMVVCMSGYRGSSAIAIPLDSTGDVTDSSDLRWEVRRGTPYIASPVLYRDRIYFNGSLDPVLSCVSASDGEAVIESTRVEEFGRIYASPVAANGYIYFVDRDGTTMVLDADGDSFDAVAINRLDDPIDASPAIVGDTILLRGKEFLYCIGE